MIIKCVEQLKNIRGETASLGFVPTMGYLHEGHVSLIKKARQENDQVVVSVFVNPTQFGPNEDIETYPKNIERDQAMAVSAGADYVFYPHISTIYPEGASTYVTVEGPIANILCAKSRPDHFKGVTTVVNILLNMVQPDRVYFGQKDAQQAILIQKMARDLHMPVDVVVCPIVREYDGLALSSRNVHLTREERKQAQCLYQALQDAKNLVKSKDQKAADLVQVMKNRINHKPLVNIDYVEIREARDLSPVTVVKAHPDSHKVSLALVAAWVGKTRLIDNMFLNEE